MFSEFFIQNPFSKFLPGLFRISLYSFKPKSSADTLTIAWRILPFIYQTYHILITLPRRLSNQCTPITHKYYAFVCGLMLLFNWSNFFFPEIRSVYMKYISYGRAAIATLHVKNIYKCVFFTQNFEKGAIMEFLQISRVFGGRYFSTKRKW